MASNVSLTASVLKNIKHTIFAKLLQREVGKNMLKIASPSLPNKKRMISLFIVAGATRQKTNLFRVDVSVL